MVYATNSTQMSTTLDWLTTTRQPDNASGEASGHLGQKVHHSCKQIFSVGYKKEYYAYKT